MTLPPGPTTPASLQLYRYLRDPVALAEDARRRFGEIFTLRLSRVGELVLFSDPASVKRLFAADRDNRLPAGRALVLEPVMGPRSVLLLEGEEHLRRRRWMLPPFHGERMRAYEQVIADEAVREIRRWPVGERFRLHPRMQAITLEVILRAVFGVEDPGRRSALREQLRTILALTASPFRQALGLASRPLGRMGPYRGFLRLLQRTDRLLFEEIARRRDDPDLEAREDILSMLVAARDEDGTGMDDTELRDQLMTLLLAGHETTATALAWTFDLLFHSPEAMARLRAEAQGEDAMYADAVAKEAMRVRPVIFSVGRELAAPMELGGWELPAGTGVFPCIYMVHTREDLYPEPLAFRPERFLDGAPETFSWIPFGGGTRRCLGAAFAQLEMRIVLREVMRHALLEAGSARPERAAYRQVTIAPRGRTPAILRERLVPAA
jgi:cytochrome P450 family 135